MIKIIATIHSFGAAVNVGGSVESTSYEIGVLEVLVPTQVLWHLKDENARKWQTLSLSILSESLDNTPPIE